MWLRFAVTAVCLGLSWPAAGQTNASPPKESIELQQGAQIVLRTTKPFSSVAIADPDVADALPRSDRTLVIVGKRVGAADIIIFSDADPIYHATISVTQPTAGKIFNHNQKDLSDYKAYQCNPACVRTDDKFEQKQVLILGGGLNQPVAVGGNTSINVQMPPAPPAATQAR